jgi:diguanylate cyclase (GGDEF)-like protein
VKGAGTITVVAGGLPVLAAWLLGLSGLATPYRSLTDVLAEVFAVVLVVLAWRFRRGRLAAAAVVIGAANFLVRDPLSAEPHGPVWAALSYLVPIALAGLALLPERPATRAPIPVVIGLTLATAAAANFAAGTPATVGLPGPLAVLAAPDVARLAFLIAAAFAALAFAARRGAFEGSLLWVIVAAAVALLADTEIQASAMALTAGQLVLMIGFIEDSYRLAYHDELTGLPSRRAFEEAIQSLRGSYSIAMLDIDHFKRFNDRHGHTAGDQALRMVATELGGVDSGGRSYRYGGEEFAVLFPATEPTDARMALETVRQSIATRRFAIRGPDRPRKKPDRPQSSNRKPRLISLSVSIGLAGPNRQRTSPDAVLRAADNALYRAKKAGRNRLVAAGDRSR